LLAKYVRIDPDSHWPGQPRLAGLAIERDVRENGFLKAEANRKKQQKGGSV
jgi:hypothetical protein